MQERSWRKLTDLVLRGVDSIWLTPTFDELCRTSKS